MLAFLGLTLFLGCAERREVAATVEGVGSRLATASGIALLAVSWISLAFPSELAGATATAWIAGAPLLVLGIALRLSAIRALGALFVSRVDVWPDHRLVQAGPFRWMRHPSEAGLVLVALGSAILLGSAAGVATTLIVLVPLSLHRARREERALRHLLGTAYRDYASRVKAWLPGIA